MLFIILWVYKTRIEKKSTMQSLKAYSDGSSSTE